MFDFETTLDSLRRDGRAAGDQVARTRGVDVTATWTDDELKGIGVAQEHCQHPTRSEHGHDRDVLVLVIKIGHRREVYR